VIAINAELDGWVTATPLRESFRLSPVALDQDALLKEFRRNIAELHRLRQETSELRKTLHSSMEFCITNFVLLWREKPSVLLGNIANRQMYLTSDSKKSPVTYPQSDQGAFAAI